MFTQCVRVCESSTPSELALPVTSRSSTLMLRLENLNWLQWEMWKLRPFILVNLFFILLNCFLLSSVMFSWWSVVCLEGHLGGGGGWKLDYVGNPLWYDKHFDWKLPEKTLGPIEPKIQEIWPGCFFFFLNMLLNLRHSKSALTAVNSRFGCQFLFQYFIPVAVADRGVINHLQSAWNKLKILLKRRVIFCVRMIPPATPPSETGT